MTYIHKIGLKTKTQSRKAISKSKIFRLKPGNLTKSVDRDGWPTPSCANFTDIDTHVYWISVTIAAKIIMRINFFLLVVVVETGNSNTDILAADPDEQFSRAMIQKSTQYIVHLKKNPGGRLLQPLQPLQPVRRSQFVFRILFF